jgi:hypothetical protein
MQLSEALRLVRRIEPEAMLHRDHICSESVTHDLGHCPKMLSQIYAWRVESNTLPKPINRAQSTRGIRQGPAVTRGATSLNGYPERARPNTNFRETRE